MTETKVERLVEVRPDQLRDIVGFIQESYWGQNRSVEQICRSFEASFCFRLSVDRETAGFARVVSDQCFFAYILDVIVLPAFQKRGLSYKLLDAIFADEDLKDVTRFMLATRDTQGLYEKYGFERVDPSRYMVRKQNIAPLPQR